MKDLFAVEKAAIRT